MQAKRLLCLLVFLALCLSLVGCKPREYIYCEVGITLPRSYRPFDASGEYDLAFRDGDTVIGVRRISFDAAIKEGILATHSPLKFAEIYRDRVVGEGDAVMREHGDIPYFSYTRATSSGTYVYTPAFFRTPYAYFILILVTENSLQVGGCVAFLDICDTFRILPEYV